jgi:hypothetical protein
VQNPDQTVRELAQRSPCPPPRRGGGRRRRALRNWRISQLGLDARARRRAGRCARTGATRRPDRRAPAWPRPGPRAGRGSTRAAPAQALQLPGPVPDQALVRARDQLQTLHLARVASDRAVMFAVERDDLGEHMGITRVGLRPRRGVAFAVAGRRHRVDREHLIAGHEQRGDPGTAVGFDPTTTRPAASIPVSESRSASSRCSAINACSRVIPVMPSGNRARPSRFPSLSTISTSWWSSAQSSPTNSTSLPPAVGSTVGRQRGGRPPRPNGQVLTDAATNFGPRHRARHPISGPTCSRPAGARSDFRAQAPVRRVRPAGRYPRRA